MGAMGVDHKTGRTSDLTNYLEQYYREGAAPAETFGQLCPELGFSTYSTEAFARLLEGQMPDGTQLTGQGEKRRKMSDVTFGAPKSVSALALTTDPRLVEAHQRAVREALGQLEQRAASARLGKGGAERIYTNKIAAALFLHEDARPVDGVVSPQLHTHCAVLNVTEHNGQYRALDLDLGASFDMGQFVESSYLSALAKETQALGYEIRETKDGFEIEGVTRDQIEALSIREAQILEKMRETGADRLGLTGAERAKYVLGTRESKKNQPVEQMREGFRDLVKAAGIDPEKIKQRAWDRKVSGENTLSTEEGRLSASAKAAALEALEHLSERDSVFTERRLIVEAMKNGRATGFSAEQLGTAITELEKSGQILRRDGLVTTREMLEAEADCIQIVEQGQGTHTALMTEDQAAENIDAINKQVLKDSGGKFKLTAGQEDAIRLGFTTKDRVFAVRGAAGTGKTSSAIKAVADAAKAQGVEVVALAPTGDAAAGLRDIGTAGSDTLEGHMLKDKGNQGERLYIVDEAGMIGTREMRDFLQKAQREGARVMLVGDQLQLQAVSAGNAFEQLQEQTQMKTADMAQIIRQKDAQQREMVEAFATGDAKRGAELLRSYVKLVDVHETKKKLSKKEKSERADRALADQVAKAFISKTQEVQAQTIVVSGTNRVRTAINERIREDAVKRGQIDTTRQVNFEALDKDSALTRVKMKRATNYREGHRLVGEMKEPGAHGKKQPLDVRVIDALDRYRLRVADAKTGEERTLDLRKVKADKLRVYKSREMQVAPGDQLIFREATKVGYDKVTNKTRATVEAVEDGKIRLKTDSGKALELDAKKATALDYGWAVTVHAAQGATKRGAIWAATGSKFETANLGYVAASRQTDSLEIFTHDAGKVEKSITKWSQSVDARSLKAGEFTQAKRQAVEALKREHEIEREQQAQTKTQRQSRSPVRVRSRGRGGISY